MHTAKLKPSVLINKMEIFLNLQYRQTEYSANTNSHQKKINTGEMCDYYDRDEACDKTIDTEDAVNYYKYRIGSNGGWGKNGDFKADEDKKMFEKYKPENIYRMVISFDESFAKENKILSKKNMKELITKSMNKNIKELGLNPDNVEWGCYYHTNTGHPHIHAFIFEKESNRKDYRIKQSAFKKMKSNIIRNMNINSELYIERDSVKKEIIDAVKELGLDTSKLYNSNNSRKIFKYDRHINNMFKKLEKIIPKTGSLKYNSANIMPYRPQIDKMVDAILEKDSIKPVYQKYKELLIKEQDIFNNRYFSKDESKEKNKSVENKDKELRDRIANMILQNIKYYREDIDDFKDEFENDDVAADDTVKTCTKCSANSMKHRSRCLEAGVLDDLSRTLSKLHYDLKEQEQVLNNMIEKAKAQSKNNTYTLGG